MSTTSANLIFESFELAAERSSDLTPLVYERLFELRPETRGLFRSDPNNFIKGSMLELALEAILDFAGERKAAHRLIFCEVQSHDAYGTQPEIFAVFFTAIADVVRRLIEDRWSPEFEMAWTQTLGELQAYVDEAVKAMRPAA